MTEKTRTTIHELTMTRILHAPRELVWEAWTKPEHLAQWWGPRGMANPVCEWDPVPGKRLYLEVQSPDGTIYPMEGKFLEIIKPSRLVFIGAALDENGNRSLEGKTSVYFKSEGQKTKITLHISITGVTDIGESHLAGMQEGWKQSLDKLTEHLVRTKHIRLNKENSKRKIIITRILNAPKNLVWEAWTKPEQITEWWGPIGFTTTTESMNVYPGGAWRFMMHGPDGANFPNKIVYLEVTKPERLVYKHAGDDDTEWINFHVAVTFQEYEKRTLLTMISTFDSAEDLARVDKEYGAIEGAHQTINRLENHLKKL